jgi:hypothetical protein
MCYIQITEKCNMSCDHCCYSCTMQGQHMPLQTAKMAIDFAVDNGFDEALSIGGGEPTLHPDFFEILKYALDSGCNVWMATNGSQTEVMKRLYNIIIENDWDSFECTCEASLDPDDPDYYEDCNCQHDYITADKRLSVALSMDIYHDPIDYWVSDTWRTMSEKNQWHSDSYNGFEIRNVIGGVKAEGRAIETGVAEEEGCVCSFPIVKIDGSVRLCGCSDSPEIGNIWDGIIDTFYYKNECVKQMEVEHE